MSPYIGDRIGAAVLYVIVAAIVAWFARSKGARPATYIALGVFYPIALMIAGTWVWMQDMKS